MMNLFVYASVPPALDVSERPCWRQVDSGIMGWVITLEGAARHRASRVRGRGQH